MHKLKLDLDALHVDSFETRASADGAGTVAGHAGYAHEMAAVGPGKTVVVAPVTLKDSCMIDFCADSWLSGCQSCGAKTCGDSCISHCLTDLCGVTDGCTAYTCPSGADICCA